MLAVTIFYYKQYNALMIEEIKDIRLSIERKFQFIITLTVFFATLLLNFFKFAGTTEQEANKLFITVGGYVTVYLISYVFFSSYDIDTIKFGYAELKLQS